jgi:hypothetical protein
MGRIIHWKGSKVGRTGNICRIRRHLSILSIKRADMENVIS